jgi:hypothetical protein
MCLCVEPKIVSAFQRTGGGGSGQSATTRPTKKYPTRLLDNSIHGLRGSEEKEKMKKKQRKSEIMTHKK